MHYWHTRRLLLPPLHIGGEAPKHVTFDDIEKLLNIEGADITPLIMLARPDKDCKMLQALA